MSKQRFLILSHQIPVEDRPPLLLSRVSRRVTKRLRQSKLCCMICTIYPYVSLHSKGMGCPLFLRLPWECRNGRPLPPPSGEYISHQTPKKKKKSFGNNKTTKIRRLFIFFWFPHHIYFSLPFSMVNFFTHTIHYITYIHIYIYILPL